jgi:hypothetical protein
MGQKINTLLDFLSEFLAPRKGLLLIISIILVLLNLLLQFIPAAGWLAASNILLHLGIIIALIGIMLAWAL